LTTDELTARIPDLKGLVPVANREKTEEVLPVILGRVGENIEQFYAKVPDVTSREDITMESLWPHSKVVFSRRQSFQYLLISRSSEGVSGLQEYRTDITGKQVEPTGLQEGMAVTRGFAAAGVLFHPAIRSDAFFRYLGTQRVGGTDTDVVAFAQRPGWAQAVIRTNVAGRTVSVLVQGLAWIDATGYQIVRMRMDLLAPRPDVGLLGEVTDISFGEIRFPELPGTIIWLPKEVKVTIERETKTKIVKYERAPSIDLPRGQVIVGEDSSGEADTRPTTSQDLRIYRNTHRYSNYQLFSAQSKLVF